MYLLAVVVVLYLLYMASSYYVIQFTLKEHETPTKRTLSHSTHVATVVFESRSSMFMFVDVCLWLLNMIAPILFFKHSYILYFSVD